MDSTTATAAPNFDVHLLDVPRARAAGIEVFCLTFDFDATLDHPCFAVLSADERAKAARFQRHEDTLRHAATRVVLRRLLAERTGVAAAELRFERDAAGRPRLVPAQEPQPDFNVSHSGRHALIAIAARGRVGVDIEVARTDMNWQALVPAVFAPGDEACVAALPVEQRGDAFFSVWTAKEALLKALGVGIGDGMTWFSVLGEAQHEPRVEVSDASARRASLITGLDAVWLAVSPGYCGCIAWSRDAAVRSG
ncbi:4'-phosphopantetheinyl transferase superfamily protein [Burkholderia sp. Ax-1724]|uniref:4'-phosphopantetheinyl transferase family protein n=1 Tax=Burkholderia sp. Ax-1724 TaxID=2608336 RepID=UPI00141E0938|nr:4'-phosphopantetheinyl transferase superfamily protein [Burkholderia sp. Ax-1724]NIF52005.1 4'-phosphopantetheinyl transferase superfamily protein [Burkholderia sp. Ax-1724]